MTTPYLIKYPSKKRDYITKQCNLPRVKTY
ncbi:MAG: hypothetical protein ACI82S_002103 [Patiriisocius sp.]